MDPYPHGIKHLKGWKWVEAVGTIGVIICALLFFWLIHVMFIGWFCYYFRPTGYLIRVGDIEEDMEIRGSRWWNKYHCELAHKVVKMNDPDELAMFTWRTHPFFLDNDILYVKSKGLRARVWDEREKIYHFN